MWLFACRVGNWLEVRLWLARRVTPAWNSFDLVITIKGATKWTSGQEATCALQLAECSRRC